ncbi:MAG: calcium/sodium antiporter [Clostridiales bacterium]|nr:calcium/sodium antiporter [Clostridiales bacterium]
MIAELIAGNVWFAVLMLVVGFVLLVKGADIFVDGSSSVARRLRIPTIIIGLTIVAMGTSLPELAVSLTASVSDSNSMAISNVIGSNIFNTLVVVGVCAILTPVAVQRETLRRDIPFAILCAILLLVLGLIGMSVGRLDAAILLGAFVGFLVNLVRSALKARKETAPQADTLAEGKVQRENKAAENGKDSVTDDTEEEIKDISMPVSIIYIILGIICIKFGGDWTVDAAKSIALTIGMSETLVGLTIVSVGTSLPELVTSIVAASKKEVDMALGNAFGSNVFNILMVLGVAAVISPVALIMENVIDIIMLILISVMVWLFARNDESITRREGIAMVGVYVAYLIYIIVR